MNMSLTTTNLRSPESRVAHTLSALRQICDALDREPDLRPRPSVNALFSSLIEAVLLGTPGETSATAVQDPNLLSLGSRLRQLCARGEYELETAWARRVLASSQPQAELTRFPYYDNYRQLSQVELGVLASAITRRPVSMAFLGCGPLPLSSLLFARELGFAVDNIDHDPEAVALGSQMADATNRANVHFSVEDAASADLATYDVVVVAALVGDTPEDKRRILQSVGRSMAPGALLLVRSARGLRTLLYPSVPNEALAGFDVLTVVHPVNDVINSVILARAQG